MTLYIPHSILHLARLLYVRPETFGPYYVHRTSCKVPVNLVVFQLKFNFLDIFSINTQHIKLRENRPVGTELLNADGRMDGLTKDRNGK